MNQTAIAPVFTLCIPSYNRGRKALQLVETTLSKMDGDWELLVLDNASNEEKAFYDQIGVMAETEPRLTYRRHSYNREFHGNYLACVDMAQAPWIMICSDEDSPHVATIRTLLPFLHANSNLGVLRGSIVSEKEGKDCFNIIKQEIRLPAGNAALIGYGMTNNYITGTLYNLASLKKKGLLERLRQGIDAHRIYPHLYMELLIASQCEVMTTPAVVATTGEPQRTGSSAGHTMRYHSYYSFGNRIDQVVLLRNALIEAVHLVRQPFDWDLFLLLYLRLCNNYFWLVTHANMPLYRDNMLHPGLLQKSLLCLCVSGITPHLTTASRKNRMIEEIIQIYLRYQWPSQDASDATFDSLAPLLGWTAGVLPDPECFIDTVVRLDTADNVSELVQFIQGTLHDPHEMVSATVQLLAQARLRSAYILAMLLTKRGHQHEAISFALSVGGLVYNNPVEAAQGLTHLQRLVDSLSVAQQATFCQQIVVPVLSPLLAAATEQSDDQRVQHLLAIVQAAVPSWRPLFDQEPPGSEVSSEVFRQHRAEQAHRVIQAWQKGP